MNRSILMFGRFCLVWLTPLACLAVGELRADQVLVAFDKGFKVAEVKTNDAQVTLGDHRLEVSTGRKSPWPGITLKAPAGYWDLSVFERVAIEVKNSGAQKVEVCCRVDNPGADGVKQCVTDESA